MGEILHTEMVQTYDENHLIKKVNESNVEGGSARGRPPVKWISRMEE